MVYRRSARSEAVREASRGRLLKATMKLLARRGYEATTMQDIVAEAGTSIGKAYFYFQNKERLVTEAVAEAVDDLLSESERLAMQVPAGPRRLATLIARNARAIEPVGASRGLARVLDATDQRLGTIQIAEEKAIAILQRQLAECFPARDPAELPAMAAAIFGTNRLIAQRRVRGTLAMDIDAAVAFTVGWSLRALGVPEREIEAIVREVAQQP